MAAFAAVPLVYIFLAAATADKADWLRLLQGRIWLLLGNTLLLVVAVTAGALLLGVSMAWLTERTDLPGRKALRWLLAMPLAIPAYVGAIVHLALMRPRGGAIPQALASIFGGPVPTPNPFGFWGATFILTLFMYPYVYLLTGAAFRRLSASVEEASRLLGRTALETFRQVTLPVLRPGLTAGALLVSLDILAEYGTVALLRYETFSSAIYVQLAGRYDRSAAAILSAVLLSFALLLLAAELRSQGRARYALVESHWRPAALVRLGRWRGPALLAALGVVTAALLVPLAALTVWTATVVTDPSALGALLRGGSRGFGHYAWNSAWTAAIAALVAMALSLPVARLAVRHRSATSTAISRVCQVGYAVPGVVIALSLLLLVNRGLPFLYATPLIVVVAYALRYMPQALRSSEAAMRQLAPSVEEAARSLGRGPLAAFFEVTLPLILPGLLAGGALVFLSSLKELPATLLLRPAGFDTLAVRIWMWANDGFYLQAAPAALLLALASAPPLAFLLRREQIFR